MCELHDYRPGDEDAVFRIVNHVLTEYGLSTSPEVTDSDLRDIQKSYISTGGAFRVLKSGGGDIVGSYGLYAAPDGLCELRKMYLLRELRGKGLGKKMMDDAIQQAKAMGFTQMTLETNSCLWEALQLYRNFGFTEFVPDHLSDRCDIAMKRVL